MCSSTGVHRRRRGPAAWRGHHRQLNCRGAQLTGTDNDGDALAADRMKVGGDVFLDEGFTAAGAVRLPAPTSPGSSAAAAPS